MEKKICKACLIEKSIDSFYRCKNCVNGRAGTCKICKQKGNKIVRDKIHPFNLMWRKNNTDFFSMNRVTKEDYVLMWQLLEKLGYDTSKDVHQQFMDKVNSNQDKPLKIKKRAMGKQARWLANGELNPILINYKKKPPID